MDYIEVIKDLKKMKGLQLQSINPGYNITILNVTDTSIVLRTSTGKELRRSLAEIKKIVDALSTERPIHVDSILGGSGSSRNQPETILANLPYIEWLRIKKKKHIVWVKERTHPYGSNKEMDPIKASIYKAKVFTKTDNHDRNSKPQVSVTLTFCDDIVQAIDFYKLIFSNEPEKLGDDYAVFRDNISVIILRKTTNGIANGLTGPLILVKELDSRCIELNDGLNEIIKIPGNDIFLSQAIIIGPYGNIVILSEK